MNRRNFVKHTALISSVSLITSATSFARFRSQSDTSIIKPKKLQKGSTIGLITPASAIARASFEKAVENLEALEFKVKYSENMHVRKGFLGGTDAQRLKDLHSMFEDENVDGIVCARGGYGTGRLLKSLDYDLIKSNPKVLVGYSDITALLFAVHKMTGMTCFHGPVGASEFSEFTSDNFKKVLMKGKKKLSISAPKSWNENKNPEFDTLQITGGVANGALVGGNLSLLTSLLGTPYDLDFKNKIVFIEEIGESPYRLDRMLTQLLNSGKLHEANGIALGVFKGCETSPGDPDFGLSISLADVLRDRLEHLNIPTIYGLPIGHIDDNATLPLGVQAELDVDKATLTILESAVA